MPGDFEGPDMSYYGDPTDPNFQPQAAPAAVEQKPAEVNEPPVVTEKKETNIEIKKTETLSLGYGPIREFDYQDGIAAFLTSGKFVKMDFNDKDAPVVTERRSSLDNRGSFDPYHDKLKLKKDGRCLALNYRTLYEEDQFGDFNHVDTSIQDIMDMIETPDGILIVNAGGDAQILDTDRVFELDLVKDAGYVLGAKMAPDGSLIVEHGRGVVRYELGKLKKLKGEIISGKSRFTGKFAGFVVTDNNKVVMLPNKMDDQESKIYISDIETPLQQNVRLDTKSIHALASLGSGLIAVAGNRDSQASYFAIVDSKDAKIIGEYTVMTRSIEEIIPISATKFALRCVDQFDNNRENTLQIFNIETGEVSAAENKVEEQPKTAEPLVDSEQEKEAKIEFEVEKTYDLGKEMIRDFAFNDNLAAFINPGGQLVKIDYDNEGKRTIKDVGVRGRGFYQGNLRMGGDKVIITEDGLCQVLSDGRIFIEGKDESEDKLVEAPSAAAVSLVEVGDDTLVVGHYGEASFLKRREQLKFNLFGSCGPVRSAEPDGKDGFFVQHLNDLVHYTPYELGGYKGQILTDAMFGRESIMDSAVTKAGDFAVMTYANPNGESEAKLSIYGKENSESFPVDASSFALAEISKGVFAIASAKNDYQPKITILNTKTHQVLYEMNFNGLGKIEDMILIAENKIAIRSSDLSGDEPKNTLSIINIKTGEAESNIDQTEVASDTEAIKMKSRLEEIRNTLDEMIKDLGKEK
jgi:hypothetical protein